MEMQNWLFAISIVASIFCGLKMKSKCCGRECSISIEREERDEEVLRSVRIGRRQRVEPIEPTLELPPIQRSNTSP
jgi:hypothetical protein